jgi:hypothetical protein
MISFKKIGICFVLSRDIQNFNAAAISDIINFLDTGVIWKNIANSMPS